MPDNLESVNLATLTMQEACAALFEGKYILVKNYEKSRNEDVIVRIEPDARVPVTQISYDKVPPDGFWRDQYWIIFDIPLNVFSTYPCFIYDLDMAKQAPKFTVTDTVYYTSKSDETKDSAIVVEVLKDEEGRWYYKLSRDLEIYEEHELSKDRLK